jgi:hypothetical protein
MQHDLDKVRFVVFCFLLSRSECAVNRINHSHELAARYSQSTAPDTGARLRTSNSPTFSRAHAPCPLPSTARCYTAPRMLQVSHALVWVFTCSCLRHSVQRSMAMLSWIPSHCARHVRARCATSVRLDCRDCAHVSRSVSAYSRTLPCVSPLHMHAERVRGALQRQLSVLFSKGASRAISRHFAFKCNPASDAAERAAQAHEGPLASLPHVY